MFLDSKPKPPVEIASETDVVEVVVPVACTQPDCKQLQLNAVRCDKKETLGA